MTIRHICYIALWVICVSFSTSTPTNAQSLSATNMSIENLIIAASSKGEAFYRDTVLFLMETNREIDDEILSFALSLDGAPTNLLSAQETAPVLPAVPVPTVAEEALSASTTETAVVASNAGFFNKENWDISAEFGYAGSTGDTEEQAVTVGLNLASDLGNHWSHAFEFDVDYARRQGVSSKERYFGDYQLEYKGWDTVYAFGFLQAEHDKFSGFLYQISENFGLGMNIMDDDKHKWTLEGGPGLRHEKLVAGPTNHRFTFLAKNTYRYTVKDGVWVQNETKGFVNSRGLVLDNTLSALTNIAGRLSARASFNLKYESEPPAGTTGTDTLTKVTLVYDF